MKNLIILLLILNFIPFGLHAQNTEIDSLENLLANHPQTDTVKIDLLNEIAFKARFYDLNKTLQYATLADSLSNIVDYIKGKAKSLKIKAIYYQTILDYPQALKYFQRALGISRKIGDKATTASCYNGIGSIYTDQGNFPRALENLQKSLSICEQIGNQHYIAALNTNIGNLHLKQNANEEALSYFLKAADFYEKTGANMNLTIAYLNIVAAYIGMDNSYDSLALSYTDKLISLCKTLGANETLTQAFISRGIIQESLGNYSLAKQHYLEAISTTEKTNDIYGSWAANYSLAHLYEATGKYDLALKYALVAYKQTKKLNQLKETSQTAQMLAAIYKEKKQYKEAYEYHVEFKTTADSMFNESNVKKITNLENQYEFNKEKEAIATEQAKKDAIQTEELKRQKVVRNSFIVGFVLMIIFAFVIFRNLAQKEEIETQAEELQTTNEKLVELDHFKQGLTSMIVHDLKNPLNGILNVSKSYSPENQVVQMKQIGKQMLNMVLNILDVNKFEDSQMTLDKTRIALAQTANKAIVGIQFLSNRKNITIQNTIPDEIVVNADSEIIERVFTNLLTNAIKYTPNNGTIILSANQSESISGFVKVQVTDSGQGIPKDKLSTVFDKFGQVSAKKSGGVRSTGLGLTFCKMAVEAHGGNISAESEIGMGTSFIFTLPLGTEFEKVVANEKTVPSKPKLILSDKDKELLEPYVKELSTLMVYEISNVKKVLDSINFKESESVENWIIEIRNSLFAMNEEKFNDLLNQIREK